MNAPTPETRQHRRVIRSALLLAAALFAFFFHLLRPPLALPPHEQNMFIFTRIGDAPYIYPASDTDKQLEYGGTGTILATARLAHPVLSLLGEPLIVTTELEVNLRPIPAHAWPWPGRSADEIVEEMRPQVAALLLQRRTDPITARWTRPDWWKRPHHTILWAHAAATALSWSALPLAFLGIYYLFWPSRAEWAHARLRRGICPTCRYDLTNVAERCPECGRAIKREEAELVRASQAQE